MRIVSTAWLVLLAAMAAVCAAPVKTPDSAKAPPLAESEFRAESLSYARNLAMYVDKIEEAYVRPVRHEDLYFAALEGLYEAADQPVPASLKADVRQGIKSDLVGMLVRVRESLGQQEALRGQGALLASLKALPRALDPYCGVTPRFEFQRLDLTDGTINCGLEFVGVPLAPVGPAMLPGGGRLESSGIGPSGQPAANPAGPLRVLTVSPGSPGQKVGLRPGDLIVGLDRKPPQSPGFTAAFQRLRPLQAGTIPAASLPPVGLTVRRSGRPEPFETSLELTEYHTESVFGVRRKVDGSWDYMLDPAARIGYVRLGGIRNWSAVEFRDALFSLRSSGVRGLLLDLRWCPGGMLDEAIVIVRLFLPDELPRSKPVFWQCDKAGGRIPTSKPLVGQLLEGSVTDLPVLVLINSETSGGGELIAAALQDHGRAVVAGQRTVGKASIQKELEMRDRGPEPRIPFKVTMSTFLRANGKNLQRFADSRWSDDWGVRPDDGRELPLTPEAGRRFKEWWTLQILRPPTDTEALPLDDPENDPQRLAAVHMLQEMMNQ